MNAQEIERGNKDMAADIVKMIGEAIGNPAIPPCNYNDVVRDFRNAITLAIGLLRSEKGIGAKMALAPLEQALKNAGLDKENQ